MDSRSTTMHKSVSASVRTQLITLTQESQAITVFLAQLTTIAQDADSTLINNFLFVLSAPMETSLLLTKDVLQVVNLQVTTSL